MDLMKRFTRIITDAAGGSAFQDGEISLETELVITGTPPLFAGAVPIASTGLFVRADTTGGSPEPLSHPAPRRQWVVILGGELEVEVTDGSRRQFGPGDLVHAEDTDGPGHITRILGEVPVELLFLPS